MTTPIHPLKEGEKKMDENEKCPFCDCEVKYTDDSKTILYHTVNNCILDGWAIPVDKWIKRRAEIEKSLEDRLNYLDESINNMREWKQISTDIIVQLADASGIDFTKLKDKP